VTEFFHLNPAFFPQSTKDYLSVETILKWGVLPIGTKRGWWPFRSSSLLNVGFVDPKNREGLREVKRLVQEKRELSGVQIYRLSPSEFLSVLASAYGLDRERLLALPGPSLSPALRAALEAPPTNPETP
jgi:hypothetical protein